MQVYLIEPCILTFIPHFFASVTTITCTMLTAIGVSVPIIVPVGAAVG